MFRVYFTNHQYYRLGQFKDVFSALDYVKSKGMDAAVHYKPDNTAEVILGWSVITGTKWFYRHDNTAQSAAFLLGITRRTLTEYCQKGQLGYKQGRDWYITMQELEEFAKTERKVGRPLKGEE